MSTYLPQLTAIIINYKTKNLTRHCVETFLEHYPLLPILLIDNGSEDESTDYIRHIANRYQNISALLNRKNRYHGPAMDQGIRFCQTPYLFTLDSDCEIMQTDFLEQMLEYFRMPRLYAIGRLTYLNRYGFEATTKLEKQIKYIHPYAMLLDRAKYLQLPSFIHHGSPCIYNMKKAQQVGYTVKNFMLDDFIRHKGRGTCGKYGYGLRAKTSLSIFLHKWGFFG